jgi:predicted permease
MTDMHPWAVAADLDTASVLIQSLTGFRPACFRAPYGDHDDMVDLVASFISFVICVGVASWARSGGVTAVFSVFKTPALIALIPALVFNITDLEVPIFLSRLSGLLGQAMIPVMLITLGVQMGEIPKIKINFNVFAASTVRLIGGPVLALLIVPYFGLEGLERSTGILQAAMPAAVLASIIALEYKLLPEFVTTTVLFSTLYSILTLTVILTFI